MQRCSFCNNSILDFESPIAEGPRVYHKKCHTTAVGSRETISQGNETRLKHEEAFKKQPKIIGEVVIDEGSGGFVVDPVTGEKRAVSRPSGQGYAPSGVKTQPALQGNK